MPAYTYYTNELVTDAYKLIAVIDENDTLDEVQMRTGVKYINQILSVDEQAGLNVPYFKILQFNFIPNQAKYKFSLDEDADYVTPPIVLVENMQLLLESKTRIPIQPRNRDQFLNSMKYQPSVGQPQEYLFTRDINESYIEFWPTPNVTWPCQVSCKVMFREVQENTDLTQVPTYFIEYLQYALAFKLGLRYADAMWSARHDARLAELKKVLASTCDTDYSIQPSPVLLATRNYPIVNNLVLP